MRTIFFVIAIFLCAGAQAQKFGQKLTGGFNLSLGLPSGEFKEVNNNAALGLRGHLMYNPARNIPLYLGLEFGYSVMGSETVYFYDSWMDQYEVTASSNIFSLQFKLRVQQPKKVLLRPFAEGIIGWNDFFSTVNVERVSYFGPGYPDYGYNYGNSSEAKWAMTYGGAAGLDIRLNPQGNLWLELKTAYMIGRKTTYLTDPQITGTGQVYFTERESETNMVIPQVGVKFGL